MTHLSDFSFLQRAVSFTYLYIFMILRIYQVNRFQCLSLSRLRAGELKSIVTVLIMITVPFQLYYDWTSTRIKYEEGFMAYPVGNSVMIISKPYQNWTNADQALVEPTDYSLCVGFSLQTGTLFLLQSFWNYLANSVAKASFMGSLEFKWYILWCGVSIIMFPVLQYNFSQSEYAPTWKEIIPELAYGVELFIVFLLGVKSHFRFSKLITQTRNSSNSKTIVQKLSYFMEMNKILTAALFVVSASLITLSVDGLMPGAYLNSHKFTADLLICNANLFSMVIWFLLIMIFHPRHGYGGVETTSSFNTTSGQARTHVIDGTHFVVPVNDNNTHLNGQSTGYIPYNVNDIAQYIESPSPPTTPKYQTYATNPPPKSPKSPQRPMSPARKGPSSENPNNAWGETRPLATDQGVELYSANSDSSLPRRPCSPVVTVPRPLSSTSGTYRPRAEDISMQTIMFDDEYEMPPARQ